MERIVSNTSPIIILAKTNKLTLLKNVFEKIYIPQSVYDEIIIKKDTVSKQIKEAEYIKIVKVKNSELLQNLYTLVDKGEAEAITLAKDLDTKLIIDEKKGRAVATDLQLKIVGFLGVVFLNYIKNYITKPEVIQLLKQSNDLGYRLSTNLKNQFLNSL